jgi:5S rRNA maturation endonuclease (ribonuclease M5)
MANAAILKLLKTKFGKAKAVSGGNYRIKCPTCEPKNSGKMKRYISPAWPMSNCFICEKLLKVNELLVTDNFEFVSSVGNEINDVDDYPKAKIFPFDKVNFLHALSPDEPVIEFMRKDYLNDFAYYASLGIAYIPIDGGINLEFDSGYKINTGDSLFFPVKYQGRYVGWQLRFIPGTLNGDRLQYMRYLHMFPKGNFLFNYDEAKKYDEVIVVEGVKKALKLPNAVATFGKGISAAQKQLIQEWKKITLILDGEEKTQELARELVSEFKYNGRQVVNIDPRDYGLTSPDEATAEQLKKIVTELWTPLNHPS